MASIKLKLLKQSERHGGCMSNYVKNLMKAAGVKPETVTDYELNEYHIYPEFTPARQLELIKLIANIKEVECFYIQTNKNGYKISCLIETTNFSATVIATDPVMDITLAKLLIKLLKKRELDKSEVKKILED